MIVLTTIIEVAKIPVYITLKQCILCTTLSTIAIMMAVVTYL